MEVRKRLTTAVLAVATAATMMALTPAALADVVHGSDQSCTPAPAVQAVEGVEGFWQNFEPNEEQGTFEGPPTWPTDERGTWSDAKEDGGPGKDESGVFQNGEGNGSWFYRAQGVEAVEGRDAILCEWHTWDTNAWTPDATNSSGVNWPQTYVGAGQIAPTECEVTYQQDLYRGTRAQIDAVLDGNELTEGEDSGIVKAWVIKSTDECIEEEEPPPVVNVCADVLDGDESTNLNDLWTNVDTRATGHMEYVDGGLHVWTEGSTSTDKVSEGRGLAFPLKNTGTLDIDATAQAGNVYPYGPGLNLFVDFDNDGSLDGTLVYEEVYGQDLWLTNGSKQFVKDAAPSHTGGNGSENHGTINEWLSVFPNAQVQGFAYTLGSGVHGDWVITKVTVGCADFTFDYVEPVEEPTLVTPLPPTFEDPCGPDNVVVTVPEMEGVIYATTTEGGTVAVTATPAEGYAFTEDSPTSWSYSDTDEACETPEEPEEPEEPEGPPPAKPAKGTPTYTG